MVCHNWPGNKLLAIVDCRRWGFCAHWHGYFLMVFSVSDAAKAPLKGIPFQ